MFLLLGSAIVDFFGISVPGIRIAGGLIVSVIGLRRLFPAPAGNGPSAKRLQPVDEEIAFTWLVLRTASSLARVLGSSGLDAMTRIFGFLLVSIGIQFLLTGISDFFGLGMI